MMSSQPQALDRHPFEYVRPLPETVNTIDAIRRQCKALYEVLTTCLPSSRQRSLAITKLEEVSMWANKAAVFSQNRGSDAGDDDPAQTTCNVKMKLDVTEEQGGAAHEATARIDDAVRLQYAMAHTGFDRCSISGCTNIRGHRGTDPRCLNCVYHNAH